MILLFIFIVGLSVLIYFGLPLILPQCFKRTSRIVLNVIFSAIVIAIIAFACLVPQIQKGKFFPNLGSILLFLFTPADIWEPLATDTLVEEKSEYDFQFQHKYVGSHIVEIAYDKLPNFESAKNDFHVTLEMKVDDTVVFNKSSTFGNPFWGNERSGLIFIYYDVPQDCPVSSVVNGKITITGNISEFIKTYRNSSVSIKKGSDE